MKTPPNKSSRLPVAQMPTSWVAMALLGVGLVSSAQAPVVVTRDLAQATTQLLPGVMNKRVVVLDAAHGGADAGAHIGDSTLEKDVTLALALKLQSLLTARGMTVIMTRTSDNVEKPHASGSPMSLDDRAGTANQARAAACLLIHAAAGGSGVHLYSSELDGVSTEAAVLPWQTAQAAWVAESAHLGRQLAEALRQAGVPRLTARASVRPLDSLTCPALVVELAPETEDVNSVTDNEYQRRVAEALAAALEVWPNQTQPPQRESPADGAKISGAAATGSQP